MNSEPVLNINSRNKKAMRNNKTRLVVDSIGKKIMILLTWLTILILVFIGVGLFYKAYPIFKVNTLTQILFSTDWAPSSGQFGLLPFIVSTIWVTVVAILIAVPLCLLTAIYLSEYAPKKIVTYVAPLIDILAGIPSVIFGIWGILVIVPFVRDFLAPLFGVVSTGYSILTGGIVLSIMVFPIIIYILLEVFKTIPEDLKNAALSLGATKWLTIKKVVLRKAAPGIISAIVLGFSRALGETLAVLMVVGNVVNVPNDPIDPGYPLTALIANNYGEMMSIPMYDSAIMMGALVLFIIVFLFNLISRIILKKVERKIA